MQSSVVHCKRDEYDVYIGRGQGSVWGNPFTHKQGTAARFVVGSRDEAIEAYRTWLWAEVKSGRVTLESLASLHGKTLGCWCKPHSCHGDVLAQAAAWASAQLNGPDSSAVRASIDTPTQWGEGEPFHMEIDDDSCEEFKAPDVVAARSFALDKARKLGATVRLYAGPMLSGARLVAVYTYGS